MASRKSALNCSATRSSVVSSVLVAEKVESSIVGALDGSRGGLGVGSA